VQNRKNLKNDYIIFTGLKLISDGNWKLKPDKGNSFTYVLMVQTSKKYVKLNLDLNVSF